MNVRPREMGVPSDGGEEAVAPRVPPVPAKPTQTEQHEHHATGHAVFLRESCLMLESIMPTWDGKDPK